jgi:hypothetical protein
MCLVMTEFRRRFGTCDCRIEVQSQGIGVCAARLFTVEAERISPILDRSGQPTVLIGTSPAWAYLKAVRFLTERFGPELPAVDLSPN